MKQPKSCKMCMKCAAKRKWELSDEAITVHSGKCPECGELATLIPNRDFYKDGKRVIESPFDWI